MAKRIKQAPRTTYGFNVTPEDLVAALRAEHPEANRTYMQRTPDGSNRTPPRRSKPFKIPYRSGLIYTSGHKRVWS